MNHKKIGSVLALLLSSRLFGQVSPPQLFYDDLRANPPQGEIALARINEVIKPLEVAPAPEVARALASIRQAASHSNIYVQLSAVAALLDLAVVRDDSAIVLLSEFGVLEGLLNHPDPRIADSSLGILSYLKPVPPLQVIPVLLRFAQRTDANAQRQAKALATALIQDSMARRLKQESQEPDILAVVERFAARDLDPRSRIALLDGIGLAGLESNAGRNPRLTAIVVAGLRHPNADVRKRGLVNLMRLGQENIRGASVDVERLRTQDPNAEVRAEAEKALRVMGGIQP